MVVLEGCLWSFWRVIFGRFGGSYLDVLEGFHKCGAIDHQTTPFLVRRHRDVVVIIVTAAHDEPPPPPPPLTRRRRHHHRHAATDGETAAAAISDVVVADG